MAKPTPIVYPDPNPPPDRPADQLAQALGMQPEALREWGRFAQAVHDHGLLTILVALMEQGPAVGAIAVDQLAQPERIAAVKNLIGVFTAMSQISPQTLRSLSAPWQATFHSAFQDQAPLGIWGLMRTLRDPAVNRGIRIVIEGLKRLGQVAPME